MNEREQFDLMVQDFAHDVGRTFAQDADGVWTIPAGGGVPVHVVYSEEARQVITFVRLGEMLPGPFRAVWARRLLEANAFWDRSRGFTFALDHETGSLVVHDRRPFSVPGKPQNDYAASFEAAKPVLDRRPYAYFMTPRHLAGHVNALAELVTETVRQLADLADLCEMSEEESTEEEKGGEDVR